MLSVVGLRARLARAGAPLVLGLALCHPVMAVEPRVPGLNELVIYDPGLHERGLPAITFEPSADGLKVDIPPIVHVHRYYYSGNREYQGPLIDGGPTIVVANHPKTGERMYIDVMLPAGAPVIEYDASTITYAFPDRRVILHFSCISHEKVTVKYLSGKGWARKFHEYKQEKREECRTAMQQSALVGATRDVCEDVSKVAVGAVGVAGTAATGVVETGTKIVRAFPGVQMLQSAADQRRERLEQEGLKQAAKGQARAEQLFIRTVR
jgi:hypothetical protein